MERKAFIIANPAAAAGRLGRRLTDIDEQLKKSGLDYCLEETQNYYSKNPRERVRELDLVQKGTRKHDFIVALGGDGTFSNIVTAAIACRGIEFLKTCVFCVMPGGSGNDSASHHGFNTPTDAIDAIKAYQKGNLDPKKIDIASITLEDKMGLGIERYLVNTCDVGYGGELLHQLGYWKWLGGKPAYALAVISTLFSWTPTQTYVKLFEGSNMLTEKGIHASHKTDNKTHDIEISDKLLFVDVSIGKRNGGGMLMAPYADIQDGLLDAVIAGNVTRKEIVETLPKIYHGRHLFHPKIDYIQAKSVYIESEGKRQPVEVDGENAGFTPVKINIVPSVLNVLCAPQKLDYI